MDRRHRYCEFSGQLCPDAVQAVAGTLICRTTRVPLKEIKDCPLGKKKKQWKEDSDDM
jgi:hypothetical protein